MATPLIEINKATDKTVEHLIELGVLYRDANGTIHCAE